MDLFAKPLTSTGTIKSTKGQATKDNRPRIVVEVEFIVDEELFARIRENDLQSFFGEDQTVPTDFKSLMLSSKPQVCHVSFDGECGWNVYAKVAPAKISQVPASGEQDAYLVLLVVIDAPGSLELWRMLYAYITNTTATLTIHEQQEGHLPLEAPEADPPASVAENHEGKEKKMGRPKGSKNKPKVAEPQPPPAPVAPPAPPPAPEPDPDDPENETDAAAEDNEPPA